MPTWSNRTKRLSLALQRLGVQSGDRVATFCWNHYQHLEAYFAIPTSGGVLHTLNLRLHPNDLTYIAGHAGDKVVLVDEVLWPLFEKFKDTVPFAHIVVIPTTGKPTPPGTLNYEELLAAEDPARFEYPELDERQAAAMCYTSGTTGKPKGVLGLASGHRAAFDRQWPGRHAGRLRARRDQAVVPMFHANAWGLPFSCLLVGAKQVFPGPHLDPQSLLELMVAERVTVTAGVPTIWLGILQILDNNPQAYDLSSLAGDGRRRLGGAAQHDSGVSGAAQPQHRACLGHDRAVPDGHDRQSAPAGWPTGLTDEKYAFRRSRADPCRWSKMRGRNENGIIPCDGQTMGELEVRGPWIASSYYNARKGAARSPKTVGFAPATSWRFIPMAACNCKIAPRT